MTSNRSTGRLRRTYERSPYVLMSASQATPRKVVVLTTSYPRFPGDAAGRFVADAVGHVRRRGVDVDVVGPEQFSHYGVEYGHGVVGNLRRRPWLALFVPALL